MPSHFAYNLTAALTLLGPLVHAQSVGECSSALNHAGDATAPAGLTSGDWCALRAAVAREQHGARELDGILSVRHAGQSWTTRFNLDGANTTPDSADWTWGLSLRSWGFADQLAQVDQARTVKANGSTVALSWDDNLTEWWKNDERGLEHGFTIQARPDGASAHSPLQFTLDLDGSLRPEVVGDRRSVKFVDSRDLEVLRYSGLYVLDASGNDLDAWMVTEHGALTIFVDEGRAVYPLVVDPLVQGDYIKASNTESEDRFGYAVAVSGDTAVIGAPGEDSNGTGVNQATQMLNNAQSAGAAYVFRKTGANWAQEAYLKPSNTNQHALFGNSVAISGDTIAIGSIGERSNGTGVNGGAQSDKSLRDAGAVYIFHRTDTAWTQEAYVKASNTDSFDLFGHSIALSGDMLVVGVPAESSNGSGVSGGSQGDNSASWSGAAYVFTRIGTTWAQDAYLKASNSQAGDSFGWAVSVSGQTVAVGAPGESSHGTGVNSSTQSNNQRGGSGAAYVFRKAGGAWSQEAYVKASNSDFHDRFGRAIALHADTMIVSSPYEDSHGTGVNSGEQADNSRLASGAAYVFERTGATWSQTAYVKASNPNFYDEFGAAVAASDDVLIVGAHEEDSSGTGLNGGGQAANDYRDSGAAYLFRRDSESWVQAAYMKASNCGIDDLFGGAVAISGGTAVVGAVHERSGGTGVNGGGESDNTLNRAGAAYIFDELPSVEVGMNFCTATNNQTGEAADIWAVGSNSVAKDDLTLWAGDLPMGTFCFFLVSDTTGLSSQPGGSFGTLCLGGAIGRFVGPGQVQSADADGTISLSLELMQIPRPNGGVAVQSGETWHFSTWFRDSLAGLTGSNFSNGLSIQFQ